MLRQRMLKYSGCCGCGVYSLLRKRMLSWIFAGLVTVVLGFAVFWILPDTPELAIGRLLTHDEARFLRLSHNLARGVTTNQPVNPNGKKRSAQWSFFVQVIKDWQIYLLAIVITSNSVPNYGLKFTMPQIIKNNKQIPLLFTPIFDTH